jgi:hypothetical protein
LDNWIELERAPADRRDGEDVVRRVGEMRQPAADHLAHALGDRDAPLTRSVGVEPSVRRK